VRSGALRVSYEGYKYMVVCSFLGYAVPSGVFSTGDRKVRLCSVGTINELVRRSYAVPEAKSPLFSA